MAEEKQEQELSLVLPLLTRPSTGNCLSQFDPDDSRKIDPSSAPLRSLQRIAGSQYFTKLFRRRGALVLVREKLHRVSAIT